MKSLETLDLETLNKVRKSLQIIMKETKFTKKDLVKAKTQFQTNISICYLMVERTILENLEKK